MDKVTDHSIEMAISKLLRAGVILSGTVGFIGAIFYLVQHGHEVPNYSKFRGEASADRLVGQIVKGALSLQSRSIIQLGVLLLIATPIARVALGLIGFAIERDRAYVVITLIVLAILLYSLVGGGIAG